MPASQEIELVEDGLPKREMLSLAQVLEMVRGGSDSQRNTALKELETHLVCAPADTLAALLPVVAGKCHEWDTCAQRAIAEALSSFHCDDFDPELAKATSVMAFRVIKSCSEADDTHFQLWTDLLIRVLGNVTWTEEELERVLELTDAHSSKNRLKSRQLATRVLISLSRSLQAQIVTSQIFPRVFYLLDDCNTSVRAMAIEAIGCVGAVSPIELLQNDIWPTLEGYSNDDATAVKTAALRSIMYIAGHLRKVGGDSGEFILTYLPSVFRDHMRFARNAASNDQRITDDDEYMHLEMVALCFGEMLYSCMGCSEERAIAAESAPCFVDMATCNAPVVRRHCTFNLPGVALALGEAHFAQNAALAVLTARDTDVATRRNLAASLCALTERICTRDTRAKLWTATLTTLSDSDAIVRRNVLQDLSRLVRALCSTGNAETPENFGSVLDRLEKKCTSCWRTQRALASELFQMAELLAPPVLERTVVPLLLRMSLRTTFLVRKSAMRAVAVSFRWIPPGETRGKLFADFKTVWGRASAFWMRVAFLDACLAGAEMCSFSLTRTLWASGALALANDPVVNVRLALARSLHLFTPAVQPAPAQFEKVAAILTSDPDSDVLQAIAGFDDARVAIMAESDYLERENENRERREEVVHLRFAVRKVGLTPEASNPTPNLSRVDMQSSGSSGSQPIRRHSPSKSTLLPRRHRRNLPNMLGRRRKSQSSDVRDMRSGV